MSELTEREELERKIADQQRLIICNPERKEEYRENICTCRRRIWEITDNK